MRRSVSALLGATLLFVAPLGGQIPGGHAVVATAMSGTPSTALVSADLGTGASTPLGSFPSDGLAPLAVAVDPVDLDLILALDTGSSSRIVRLELAGLTPVQEKSLATLPGTITDLDVLADGSIFVTLQGSAGGLWRIPRNGGPNALWMVQLDGVVDIDGVGLVNPFARLAMTGSPGVSSPAVTGVELDTGNLTFPITLAGGPNPVITGMHELPTGVPRFFLSHPDGTISESQFLGAPVTLALTPALPPGGTARLESDLGTIMPIALGGQAHPWLKTFDRFAPGPLTWTMLAGPFPGDPRDFAVAPDDVPRTLPFGSPCGSVTLPGMFLSSSETPQIGNTSFTLDLLNARPLVPAQLALGLTEDVALGSIPLPVTLPGGCAWLVDPQALIAVFPDALGQAAVPLGIPADPVLAGLIVFAQGIQPDGIGGYAVTQAVAVHIY